jgi:hypothetical protein
MPLEEGTAGLGLDLRGGGVASTSEWWHWRQRSGDAVDSSIEPMQVIEKGA